MAFMDQFITLNIANGDDSVIERWVNQKAKFEAKFTPFLSKNKATIIMANKYHTKSNVSEEEYLIHKHVYNLGIVNVPKIVSYNTEDHVLIMKKVGVTNLSDYYDEDASGVPSEIFSKVSRIILLLTLNGVYYPDITGYNFMMNGDTVWIIDFGHAQLRPCTEITNPHVLNVCNGIQEWNPDFR